MAPLPLAWLASAQAPSPLPAPAPAGKQGLSVVVAAGPYSSSEDTAYEPLAALLEYCGQRRPDVLLLLGPFVDAEHPAVRGGLLDETFDELFESRVRCGWGAAGGGVGGERAAELQCPRASFACGRLRSL